MQKHKGWLKARETENCQSVQSFLPHLQSLPTHFRPHLHGLQRVDFSIFHNHLEMSVLQFPNAGASLLLR